MKSSMKNSRGDHAFDITMGVISVIFLLVAAYPLYLVIIASFSDPEAVSQGKVLLYPVGFSTREYQYILKNKDIWSGYGNTILYTAAGTLIGTMMTLLAAYAMSRDDMPGRKILVKLCIFTMFFNGGMIPTYLVMQGLHLTNTRLILILMGAFSCYMIIARTFFVSNLPKELLEAAFIDGCGNTRFFFSIALPLSKAIVVVIALYIGVMYWNNYFTAMIYVTNREYYPLQLILREILVLGQQLSQSSEGMDVEAIMEMQKIQDELFDVMMAFKEQNANGNGDPNDEISFSMDSQTASALDSNSYGINFLMNCCGVHSSDYVQIDDDVVSFSPTREEYRDFLEFANKFYTNGLLDVDGFVQQTAASLALAA